MTITVKFKDWSPKTVQRELRFQASRALNESAFAARMAVSNEMPKHLTIRRPWTAKGVQVANSTHRNLIAKVGLMPKREYLIDQVTGGVRTDKAIPTKLIRRKQTQVVRKSRWPGQLLQQSGKHVLLPANGTTLPGGLSRHAGRDERLVFRREKRGRKKRLKLLYVIPSRTTIRPRFPFAEIVAKTHRAVFPKALAARMGEVID